MKFKLKFWSGAGVDMGPALISHCSDVTSPQPVASTQHSYIQLLARVTCPAQAPRVTCASFWASNRWERRKMPLLSWAELWSNSYCVAWLGTPGRLSSELNKAKDGLFADFKGCVVLVDKTECLRDESNQIRPGLNNWSRHLGDVITAQGRPHHHRGQQHNIIPAL